MTAQNLIYTGVLFFLSGVLLSLTPLPKARDFAYALFFAGSASFGAAGLLCLRVNGFSLPAVALSSFFEFSFRGDALSGFFLLVISVVACSVSVFSAGYTRRMEAGGLLASLCGLFILSMYAVVLAANVVTFLISWEAMSVISYFLVTFDRSEKSAGAGLVYAVMTHIGTAFITVLFLVLYRQTGSMDFAAMKALAGRIPENLRHLIFIFSIVGFGTKAGIIPLHTWLPKAHPAAPSNISALMSGVMIKTGIYGFIRISMDVLGQGPEWWGITVLVIGAVSSILGVLYALMEHDIKRLLAYHSVENIGIILLGAGAAMMFMNNGLYTLASIALTAALYHTLNHALFKGLLFLGAGSVMHATHTKNLEDMGGLLKAMPYTGLFFLIGSVSICALPPFNGFVSEWLTFQALLLGFAVPSTLSRIVSPLGGAALAMTGALAAACFVKAFAIAFLGMPRSRHAVDVKESSPAMIAGMAMLAVLCLAFGVLPGLAFSILSPAVLRLTGMMGVLSGGMFVRINETAAGISPALLLIMMAGLCCAVLVFMRVAGGRKKIVPGASWDCGIPALTPRMQYTATAFTKPVRMIFRRIYLPRRDMKITYLVKPFFVKSLSYSGKITPFFERYFYEAVTRCVQRTADRVKVLQSGSLHLYLAYILITLILLLIFGI